ncbi:cytochrome c biogenesis protein CcsA [bacterium BMS3Bbin11]|nr:cytochrome c biogenesis protein CcsA [bacterium BMS3Bbin11]
MQLQSFYPEGMLQVVGIFLFILTIILRWQIVGHGPFISMFEILLSSLFSLGLIFLLATSFSPGMRQATIPAYLVIILLAYWALMTGNEGGALPPTYDNNWLWAHVFMGKIFLGLNLIATSLAISGLWQVLVLKKDVSSVDLTWVETAAWRYLSISFIFHSLMLLVGALWAQDAWGRYWGWDPLESWAFVTWLSMAFALHSRVTFRYSNIIGWVIITIIFMLAFFTFFGIPFISIAPHRGAI